MSEGLFFVVKREKGAPKKNWLLLQVLGSLAYSRNALFTFVRSFLLSDALPPLQMYQRDSNWKDFREIWGLYEHLSGKSKFKKKKNLIKI